MTEHQLREFLKDHLKLVIEKRPEYHAGEQGVNYLVLKLDDEVISVITTNQLETIGEEEHPEW